VIYLTKENLEIQVYRKGEHCVSTKKATTELYRNALLKLAQSQPISKITVADIVKETGTAKQTFYNHFENKYDLINYVMLDFVEGIEDIAAMHTYKAILYVLHYCHQNKRFFTSLIRECPQNNFLDFFYHWCSHYYLRILRQQYTPGEFPPSLTQTVHLYCHGAVDIFADWVKSGMKETPELIAEVIVRSRPLLLCEYFPIENSI